MRLGDIWQERRARGQHRPHVRHEGCGAGTGHGEVGNMVKSGHAEQGWGLQAGLQLGLE